MTDYPLEKFAENGFALLPQFYDVQRDIEPIREGVRRIVELVAKKYGVEAPWATPDEAMSAGYLAVAAANRRWGSEVYDAVKQIAAFMALVADRRNSDLFERIREGSVPGIAGGGYGIRIDAPAEEKYRAPWHQEFPAQLRSLDGLVFWSPLVAIEPDMGPVEVAVGSHRDGIVPVYEDDEGIGKSGAYALHLDREQERIAKYPRIAPCTRPGDLILMDFLTLHQSGRNTGTRPRWSMQFRYFNFANETGQKIGWRGSFAANEVFSALMPELLVRSNER
jgi:Phytanoyl-CoA dioxygenase (PhyH)